MSDKNKGGENGEDFEQNPDYSNVPKGKPSTGDDKDKGGETSGGGGGE
jgi:hypothetical protein